MSNKEGREDIGLISGDELPKQYICQHLDGTLVGVDDIKVKPSIHTSTNDQEESTAEVKDKENYSEDEEGHIGTVNNASIRRIHRDDDEILEGNNSEGNTNLDEKTENDVHSDEEGIEKMSNTSNEERDDSNDDTIKFK